VEQLNVGREKNQQRLKYFMMQLTWLRSKKQDAEKPALESGKMP
jgi:hypothetical protein